MLFPFFTVADNFTACFLLFYLLIPFLNKLIHSLTEKEHFWLMTWCIGVYVVLPSFAKAHVVFNYVTWFSILYVIASYIRLYKKKMPHIGGIKIIWITFRDRQHLPDTWLPAEHFPIRY